MTKKDIKKTIQEVREHSVFNTGKQVVKYMTGAGTYAIVESIVTMAVPITIKLPVRLCVRLASVVIGAMASDKTAKYSEELIDESLDMIEEIVDVSLPEDKAELEAAKREDYIQKRTEAKTSNKESREEVANRIGIDAEKKREVYGYKTEKEVRDILTKIRAWIKLSGGSDEDVGMVATHNNYMMADPYQIYIPAEFLDKYYGLQKLLEGGSLNG